MPQKGHAHQGFDLQKLRFSDIKVNRKYHPSGTDDSDSEIVESVVVSIYDLTAVREPIVRCATFYRMERK